MPWRKRGFNRGGPRRRRRREELKTKNKSQNKNVEPYVRIVKEPKGEQFVFWIVGIFLTVFTLPSFSFAETCATCGSNDPVEKLMGFQHSDFLLNSLKNCQHNYPGSGVGVSASEICYPYRPRTAEVIPQKVLIQGVDSLSDVVKATQGCARKELNSLLNFHLDSIIKRPALSLSWATVVTFVKRRSYPYELPGLIAYKSKNKKTTVSYVVVLPEFDNWCEHKDLMWSMIKQVVKLYDQMKSVENITEAVKSSDRYFYRITQGSTGFGFIRHDYWGAMTDAQRKMLSKSPPPVTKTSTPSVAHAGDPNRLDSINPWPYFEKEAAALRVKANEAEKQLERQRIQLRGENVYVGNGKFIIKDYNVEGELFKKKWQCVHEHPELDEEKCRVQLFKTTKEQDHEILALYNTKNALEMAEYRIKNHVSLDRMVCKSDAGNIYTLPLKLSTEEGVFGSDGFVGSIVIDGACSYSEDSRNDLVNSFVERHKIKR